MSQVHFRLPFAVCQLDLREALTNQSDGQDGRGVSVTREFRTTSFLLRKALQAICRGRGLHKKDASLSWGVVVVCPKEDKDAPDARSRFAVGRKRRASAQDGTRVSQEVQGYQPDFGQTPRNPGGCPQKPQEDLPRRAEGGKRGRRRKGQEERSADSTRRTSCGRWKSD